MTDAGGSPLTAPTGYARFAVDEATVVARDDAKAGIREALQICRTLHAWASTIPGAKAYEGRATAWGARLPRTGIDVVVRHAQHGGLFASLTGDRFVHPGRAPWELAVSQRLRGAGVPTPEMVAYVLYPAGPGLCRCDVATRRLPDGADLPTRWATSDAASRDALLVATGALLRALQNIGAHHADLNATNIYVAREGSAWRAYALDVDRVRFLAPGDARVGGLNFARLRRSLRKLRDHRGLAMPEEAIAHLAGYAGLA
ncbi:MAG: lipopolysaccharide kinase InaA family protein [Gemmatimonadaceae bacterium]